MEDVRIYLSGAMSLLTFEEQSRWRSNIINAIKYGDYDFIKRPVFFNPINYFNFEEKKHKTEREIMEFDLYNLKKSDVVIVNFNNPSSIGTAMELAIANEYKIPVIAFGANGKEIHPWLLESCNRICDNMKEIVDYIVKFYLN